MIKNRIILVRCFWTQHSLRQKEVF